MVAIIHCTQEIAEDVLLLCCWLCVICDVIDEIRARETLQSKFCRSAVLPVHFYAILCCTVHMWRCLTLDARWKLYKFSKENANVRVKERKRPRGNILSTGSRNSNSQTAPTIHLTYKPQFQFQFILLSHFEHCFCKISLWDCIGQILVVQFRFNHNENKNKRKALTVYGWASKIGLLRFRFHSVL